MTEKTNYHIERIIPNSPGQKFLFQEHLTRYLFATQFVKSKIILDAACGSGYGSEILLESGAESVVGIDNSKQAIDYCNEHYQKSGLNFKIDDCYSLNFTDQYFDVVVSFETIEHLKDPKIFMKQIKRILKNDGLLIISTPNKETYSENNIFHFHEFDESEFIQLLKTYFLNVDLLYQYYPPSIYLGSFSSNRETKIKNINNNDSLNPNYFVAVCSQKKLPDYSNMMYVFNEGTLIEGKFSHLEELRNLNTSHEKHIEELQRTLEKTIQDKDDVIKHYELAIKDYKEQINQIHNSKTWKVLRKFDKMKP